MILIIGGAGALGAVLLLGGIIADTTLLVIFGAFSSRLACGTIDYGPYEDAVCAASVCLDSGELQNFA